MLIFFALRRGELLRIELQPGYLFLSVMKEEEISFKALEPQAAQDILIYLHEVNYPAIVIPFTVFEAMRRFR